MKTPLRLALTLPLVLAACGSDSTSSPDAGAGADAEVSGPDATVENWTPLITGDWNLPAGSEVTSDVRTLVLDRDIYVGAIRPIAPVGTHHTVLGVDNLMAGNIIYASGVGTNALTFPPGVGLKLLAGQTVVLQLHLFNTSDEPISGTSGIEIVEVEAADVVHEADLFLPGPFDFSIPAMQEYTHGGTCTITGTYTLFAIFPHMHQLGSHFKATLNVGGTSMVLHDAPYDFNDQAFVPFTPITLQAGDTVTTECTWTNTSGQAVGWGESSTTEMCFSILYRYPPSTEEFCID